MGLGVHGAGRAGAMCPWEENGGVRRWLLREGGALGGGQGHVCALKEVAWRKDHESEWELPAEGTPAEGVQSLFFFFGGPFLKPLLNLLQ